MDELDKNDGNDYEECDDHDVTMNNKNVKHTNEQKYVATTRPIKTIIYKLNIHSIYLGIFGM